MLTVASEVGGLTMMSSMSCAESEVCMEEYTPTREVCDCRGLLMAALDRLQAHTSVFR